MRKYDPDFDKEFEKYIQPEAPDSGTGKIIQFTYFLINTYHTLVLKTFEWWTEETCNEPKLRKINEFNMTTGRWLKPFKIPKKFTNFHGCNLTVYSNIFRINTLMIMQHEGDGAMEFHPRISEAFEKRQANEDLMADIYAEKGNFSHSKGGELDAQILQVTDWFSPVECSIALFSMPLVSMYTPPDPYTNYEKMILPFDSDTWMYLIVVFCLSFLSIFIINQFPKAFKDLVYGKNVKMPSFNVLGAFFGIGQTKLPDNNFGRIILIFFIIFCLVMRTAYQGVFFEMFTSEMRRKPPETYLDLKERNYTLYAVDLPFYDSLDCDRVCHRSNY
jgi:hypothetical protein